MAVPAVVVVDREGVIRYLYAGHDLADRPGYDKVLGALNELPETSSGREGRHGGDKGLR